ncbi:MAG: S8 family serine peptidase [Candidatus Zixiibacteriota bacterium]|nr:MAG: S8 family serine peptidase [candidate division Zixibacteria bacterium]
MLREVNIRAFVLWTPVFLLLLGLTARAEWRWTPGELVVKMGEAYSVDLVNQQFGTTVAQQLEQLDIFLLNTGGQGDLDDLAAQIEALPQVEFCHPNYLIDPLQPVQSSLPVSDVAGDGSYIDQPAAQTLSLPAAHDVATGAGVRVAVLDGGVDFVHPAFDGTAVSGYDYVDDDPDAFDEPGGENSGHGTFLAGVIHLVAPDAEIRAYRVTDIHGESNGYIVAEAILQAIADSCRVINLSMVTIEPHEAIRSAVAFGRYNGVLTVAAAGNGQSDTAHYPASDLYTIAVTAVDSLNLLADFSSYGSHIDICAPGTMIYSPYQDDGYAWWGGTSFAAPFVSAQAALIISYDPTASWSRVKGAIVASADGLDEVNPEFAGFLGQGLIDPLASMDILDWECTAAVPPVAEYEPVAEAVERLSPEVFCSAMPGEMVVSDVWADQPDGSDVYGGSFPTPVSGPIPYDDYWSEEFSYRGVNRQIDEVYVHNGELIISGHFWFVDGLETYQMARWDGTQWWPFTYEMYVEKPHVSYSAHVTEMVTYNGELIVAGRFTTINGVKANNIAAWDGSSFRPLGAGTDDEVRALAVYDGNLIVGGDFYTVDDGILAPRIAVWGGESWDCLPLNLDLQDPDDKVRTMEVFDGMLYAGGNFTADLGRNIVCWDGVVFNSVDSGLWVDSGGGGVYALEVFDDRIVAAGGFNTTGSGPVSATVAAWDGSTWNNLGAGFSRSIVTLGVYNGLLYAASGTAYVGETPVNGLAVWDGSEWSDIENVNVRHGIHLTVYQDRLIAGGNTMYMGDVVSRLVSYDGTTWSSMMTREGKGPDLPVKGITVYDGKLIACGEFDAADETAFRRIAAWDGSAWSALGEGLYAWPSVVHVYDGDLYAGGYVLGPDFNEPILQWDGQTWNTVGQALGDYSWLETMTVYDNKLIVGGRLRTPDGATDTLRGVAAWNGSSWSPLGYGLRMVYALAVYDGRLIAGGYFGEGDGFESEQVAAWDGTSWNHIGDGVTGSGGVEALAVYDGMLIAGGTFTEAGGVPCNSIAAWDGTAWSALGSGVDGRVLALIAMDGYLIVGGRFTSAGGTPAANIAAWDGSCWSHIGSGMDNEVLDFTIWNGSLWAGGEFTKAGGKPSFGVARWDGTLDGCTCCLGSTGNINGDFENSIDIGDLTRLIDYMFISYEPPACTDNCNVDGDPEGLIDVGDLTALIDYLYISFTPPAPCP